MSNKFVFVLLSSFLLVDCCLSAPVDEQDESSSIESSEEVSTLNELVNGTLEGVNEIGRLLLARGNEIIKQSIKEDAVIKVETSEMQNYIKNFTQLTERIDQTLIDKNNDSNKSVIPIVLEFTRAMDSVNVTLIKEPTKEQMVLGRAVAKHFNADVKHDMLQELKKYAEKFDRKLMEYVATFSDAKTVEQKTFLIWYKAYKNAKKFKTKAMLFVGFLEIYTPHEHANNNSKV